MIRYCIVLISPFCSTRHLGCWIFSDLWSLALFSRSRSFSFPRMWCLLACHVSHCEISSDHSHYLSSEWSKSHGSFLSAPHPVVPPIWMEPCLLNYSVSDSLPFVSAPLKEEQNVQSNLHLKSSLLSGDFHEICASLASWVLLNSVNNPFDDILAAAYWCSHTAFSSFYLHKNGDVFS